MKFIQSHMAEKRFWMAPGQCSRVEEEKEEKEEKEKEEEKEKQEKKEEEKQKEEEEPKRNEKDIEEKSNSLT